MAIKNSECACIYIYIYTYKYILMQVVASRPCVLIRSSSLPPPHATFVIFA